MINRNSLGNIYPIKKLGDVADFLDSRRKPVKECDRIIGPYPYYGANGLQGWINDFLFDENLILLAEDGGHFDNPDRGVAYKISGKTWVNNHAHVIKPKEGVDLDYLCRVLENYDLTPWITGTTRGKLTKGGASEILIPLPPLAEQRRIASILDQADELRQKRQQAIEKLDQLLQATFIDLFGDPVSNPKGWEVGCIGDMLESAKYGSSDKATLEGEIPILRMNNLTYSGEMDLRDLKYITKVQADEKYLVKEGDILFNRTNSKELVGKTAVYVGPEPMAYAGYLVRGRTKENFAPEYISAFLNSPWGKEKLQSMCKSIVGMANINAKEFQSIVLPIPPKNEQMHFKARVLAIREKKQLLVNQSNVFETLFKSLQNQAFNGTL